MNRFPIHTMQPVYQLKTVSLIAPQGDGKLFFEMACRCVWKFVTLAKVRK